MEMASSTHPTGPSILDLPFDIRCLIYGNVSQSPAPLRRVANLHDDVAVNSFNLSLLWTSRQIYEELLPIFYAVNDFTVDVSAYTSGQTLKAISPLAASYMRRLHIESPAAHSFYGSWSPTQSYRDACRILVGQMPRLRVLNLTLTSRRDFSALLLSLVRATSLWTSSARPTIELAMRLHQDSYFAPTSTRKQLQQGHLSSALNARTVPYHLPIGLRKIVIFGQLDEADCWVLAEEEFAGYELRGANLGNPLPPDKRASFNVQLVPSLKPDAGRQMTVKFLSCDDHS